MLALRKAAVQLEKFLMHFNLAKKTIKFVRYDTRASGNGHVCGLSIFLINITCFLYFFNISVFSMLLGIKSIPYIFTISNSIPFSCIHVQIKDHLFANNFLMYL